MSGLASWKAHRSLSDCPNSFCPISGRPTLMFQSRLSSKMPGSMKTSGQRPSPPYVSIPIVIKDTWIDENNSVTKGMILALLNQKGVKGVPHIVAEESVQAPLPAGRGDAAYPSDSTTVNRSRLRLPWGHLRLNDTARKAPERPGVLGYESRVHVHSYMTPYMQYPSLSSVAD